jgi:predicted GNAT superfamily acetyltransferase
MLAVEPGLQNSGIGVKLKLAQRARALERGVPLMTWTFDPLQSRNAYLNIVKLGAVVRTYQVNYYGNTSTSALHRGLDTDRLFVEWWVESEQVADALAGRPRTDQPAAAVEVPMDIQALKARDMDEARRWQLHIRAEFQRLLADGMYCAGFERGDQERHSRYLFYRDDHREKPSSHR